MRVFLSVLLATVASTCAADGDRKEQLFASWRQAQRNVKSLVILFTLETNWPSFNERQKLEGTLRLPRTARGELFGSYELPQQKPKGSGLLSNGLVYLLDDDKKHAFRFEPADGDVQGFLKEYFNPFFLLLDEQGFGHDTKGYAAAVLVYRLRGKNVHLQHQGLAAKPCQGSEVGGVHKAGGSRRMESDQVT